MLVEITSKNYPVVLDLRYGTTNNFTGHQIYKNSRCFLLMHAMPFFEKSIVLAEHQGFKLKIFDAFRPQQAQQALWDICPDPNYVAPPTKGSPHSRGVAIDLTLCDQDGNEMDMGTPFDDFTPLSHHGARVDPTANANRYLLLGIMMSAGWDLYHNEWWHYQLFNSKDYPLIENDHEMMTT